MRADFDEISAIALANGDEKSGIAFFVNQAWLGCLIMNIFGKDSVRALIIIALDPEQGCVIQRPLQPPRGFRDASGFRVSAYLFDAYLFDKDFVILSPRRVETIGQPVLVITMGNAAQIEKCGIIFGKDFRV